MRKLASVQVLLISAVLLGSCGGDDEEESPPPAFVAITNAQAASLVASAVAAAAEGLVSVGTYNSAVVSGSSGGTAIVSGTESFSNTSCGSSCIQSTNSANQTITFNDYYSRPGTSTNTRVRITGTVTFTDNRTAIQSGLNFSSSGQQRVTATSALTVRLEITDGTGTHGYADTISSLSVAGTTVNWDGTLRPSNGNTYSF